MNAASPRNILIWSNEHGAWWAPGQQGYTDSVQRAGRYTAPEAEAIVANAFLGGPVGKFLAPEVAVPDFTQTRFPGK